MMTMMIHTMIFFYTAFSRDFSPINAKKTANHVQVDVKFVDLPSTAVGYAISSHTSCDDVVSQGTALYVSRNPR